MKIDEVRDLLKIDIPNELVIHLLEHYQKGNDEFLRENWDYVGNEIGKFIEVAFRIVQNKTLNQYTLMDEKLPNINENFLKTFEQSSNANEEYRIIIPRVLYSMYCIRNKRGMIHIKSINPNRMDALYLIDSSKWVLAEFVRTISDINAEIAMQLIDDILHKTIPYIWKNDNTVRVLDTTLNVKEKVLLLLYSENRMSVEKLADCIEYKNKTNFRKCIMELHKNRLIECDKKNQCIILPNGIKCIEEKLKENK